MAYQQRDNSGSLWVNDKKTEDRHPDRTGTIIVEGVEYYLDGWLKETSGGKKFLSLSVKRKNNQSGAANSSPAKPIPTRPVRPATPPPVRQPIPDPDDGITQESDDIPF